MSSKFETLNLLDSDDVNDVRFFTANETRFSGLEPDQTYTFKYISPTEIKNAETWEHEDFDYVLNYQGFRMPKTPNNVDIGVFGCSFTFGTGMPVERMWHSILGKELNKSVGNFGVGGTSATTALDLFLILSKHVKMDTAIFLLPQFERVQLAARNNNDNSVNYLTVIPNHESRLCKQYGIDGDAVFKALTAEHLYNTVKEKLYIAEIIAKQRGIKMYVTSWGAEAYEFMERMNLRHASLLPVWFHPVEIGIDLARDGQHPGIELNKFFAEQIKEYIK